ncbi:MAG: helix-turn-helix transcriptional regulator [Candidatus Eiseniibacteriota bacterium]
MAPARVVNQVRRLRFEAGEMTQQHLADKVGVTRQTIVAIEGSKYAPSLELAFRIAHVFGKPLEEVFQYEPETRPSVDRKAPLG